MMRTPNRKRASNYSKRRQAKKQKRVITRGKLASLMTMLGLRKDEKELKTAFSRGSALGKATIVAQFAKNEQRRLHQRREGRV